MDEAKIKYFSERSRPRVYLNTSVISYLDQQDAPEKMAETREVWKLLKKGNYDIYISTMVTEELSRCKEPKKKILFNYLDEIEYKLVRVDKEIVALAEKFIDFGILKEKSFEDCRHIAAAIMSNCDVIVSWNFKHIVNINTIRGIKVVTTLEGYKDILIYPPTTLLQEVEE